MPREVAPFLAQPDRPTDEALVERTRAGDRAALDLLVERYHPRVYSIALRLLGSREVAEDVLQDTFLRVIERLDSFRGEARFSTWLFRVATNAALTRRRSTERHEAASLEEYLPEFDET